MALERSTVTSASSRSEKPVCLIWGCELKGENPTYTFEIPDEWSDDQQLTLRTICLGENAKDEFNIVEIIPPKDSKESAPVHIATLKLSVLPMTTLAGFDLTPPITFKLKSGSGPVYLAGQLIMAAASHWNKEEEESPEEMEESSEEDSPVKPAKHPPSRHVAASKEEGEPSLGKVSRKKKPAESTELMQ